MAFDVLIVDDDAQTREYLGTFIRSAGFTTEAASDGAEALEKLERDTFSVILLDVLLPGVDGLDVLARCVGKQIPSKIVVMTGVDTTETVLAALRGQAYDFIPKPIETARLIEIIKRALAARQDAPPIQVLSARPEWVELLVPCTRESADRIHGFVQHLETDLPDDVSDSVGLAFRELLLNGIEWGGRLDPAQRVRVACIRTRRMLLYRIADPGEGFSLDHLSHAAADNLSDVVTHDHVRQQKGLRPGGFGLALIRAIADELIYNERRNEVLFVKYLDEFGATTRGPAA